MRLAKLVVCRIRLPLRIAFAHSRSRRREACNIIVEAVTDRGVSGFGEGVPREYVTGETPDSAMRYLERLDCSGLGGEWGTLEESARRLRDWETAAAREGGVYPGAARCALALAVLDALARTHGLPLADAARAAREGGEWQQASRVRYSAVCSGGSIALVALSLVACRVFGFGAVKLKVGWGERRDVALARMARAFLGRKTDVRVDANGAWDTGTALRLIPRLGAYRISSVEEPLMPECRGELPLLRSRVKVPLMLDESVCSPEDAREQIDRGACDLVNIRISKCGGYLASLRMARMLRERGIGYQLGCQVGETGILSAAGRHFACTVPGIRHAEGSYDRILFRQNITGEHVGFGYGGWAPAPAGPGLGVEVRREALARAAAQRFEVPFPG